jgi:hypothetical protein
MFTNSSFGHSHQSKTFQHSILNKRLKQLESNCLVCQFNMSEKEKICRVAWGVDLIPNMPLLKDDQKVALLAVDLFSGFIRICPMKDRT